MADTSLEKCSRTTYMDRKSVLESDDITYEELGMILQVEEARLQALRRLYCYKLEKKRKQLTSNIAQNESLKYKSQKFSSSDEFKATYEIDKTNSLKKCVVSPVVSEENEKSKKSVSPNFYDFSSNDMKQTSPMELAASTNYSQQMPPVVVEDPACDEICELLLSCVETPLRTSLSEQKKLVPDDAGLFLLELGNQIIKNAFSNGDAPQYKQFDHPDSLRSAEKIRCASCDTCFTQCWSSPRKKLKFSTEFKPPTPVGVDTSFLCKNCYNSLERKNCRADTEKLQKIFSDIKVNGKLDEFYGSLSSKMFFPVPPSHAFRYGAYAVGGIPRPMSSNAIPGAYIHVQRPAVNSVSPAQVAPPLVRQMMVPVVARPRVFQNPTLIPAFHRQAPPNATHSQRLVTVPPMPMMCSAQMQIHPKATTARVVPSAIPHVAFGLKSSAVNAGDFSVGGRSMYQLRCDPTEKNEQKMKHFFKPVEPSATGEPVLLQVDKDSISDERMRSISTNHSNGGNIIGRRFSLIPSIPISARKSSDSTFNAHSTDRIISPAAEMLEPNRLIEVDLHQDFRHSSSSDEEKAHIITIKPHQQYEERMEEEHASPDLCQGPLIRK